MIASTILTTDQLEHWSRKLRNKICFSNVPDFLGWAMLSKTRNRVKMICIDDTKLMMVFRSKTWFATEVFHLANYGFTGIKVERISQSWYPFGINDAFVLRVPIKDEKMVEIMKQCLL